MEGLQEHQLPILTHEFLIIFDLFPMLSKENLERVEEGMDDVMGEEELDSDDFLSAALLRGLALKELGRCDGMHCIYFKRQ